MQASTQTPPNAPRAPGTPTPTAVTITGADGQSQTIEIPKTQRRVDALVSRRNELSDQISSVSQRRSSLVSEIRNAPDGVARTGLEDRVRVLDQRILQLEHDLSTTGQQLAAAPADLVNFSERVSNQSPGDDFESGVAAGAVPTLMVLGAVYAWRRFRRKRRKSEPQQQLERDSNDRLERLEHGVDAIAIEVERISEGQRFVTKLLSETREPVAAGRFPQSGSAQ
jgi:predicted  nucleic acid-binding Zn-ribbon protein